MTPIKLIPLVTGRAEEWANGCEQYAVHLTCDLRVILAKWPDAVPSVAFERADGEKYPHAWKREEDTLHVPLTKADTAIAGLCKCVITMISGDGQHNSDVYHGRVSQGLDTLGEEPDEPEKGIIEQVNGAAVRAETAAESANEAVAGLDETTEGKKAEIVQTAEEQMERLKSSEVVEDLVKDAIADYFEGNEITAESIGAASKNALEKHETNADNPHNVSAAQTGAAEKTHAAQHDATGDDPITPAMIGAMPADYNPPVLSVNGKTEEVKLDYSDVGAASAGYGYGEAVIDAGSLLADESALNDALDAVLNTMANGETKQIRFSISKVGSITIGDWAWKGTLFKPSGSYATLTAESSFGNRVTAISKAKAGGSWQSWEWINPPMAFDTEYRTTERYNSKPVYVKLIDGGTSADGKTIEYGVTRDRIIDVQVTMVSAPIIQRAAGETATSSAYYASFYATSNNVTLVCNESMVGSPCHVFVKYIK